MSASSIKEYPFPNNLGGSILELSTLLRFLADFSILTGEANDLMTDIHNSQKRMPLMINRRDIDAWIDDLPKASIIELMNPCDDSAMAAYTISKDIGRPKINSDVPEITEKVDYSVI